MEGIRDLSSIKDSLLTLKAILFCAESSTFLCLELIKVINKLEDIKTFDDLKREVRIEVLHGIRYLVDLQLDYYRCYAEIPDGDSAKEFIGSKIDLLEIQINKVKCLL